MTVKEFMAILSNYEGKKDVVIRYDTVVVYSERTTGAEDVIAKIDNKDMIFDDGKRIVLAADLSKDID